MIYVDHVRETIASQRSTIDNLKASCEEIRVSTELNKKAIDENSRSLKLQETVIKELKSENDDLRCEIDETRQSLLQKGVILSGNIITTFINDHPELGNRRTYKPNTDIGESLLKWTPVPESEDRDVAIPAPNIQHIQKLPNQKLLVEVTNRNEVFNLFSISKKMSRSFYVNEQLTRSRQTIMYDLRQFFKTRTDLDVSLYTRSGTPMVKVGTDDPVPVRNQREILSLISSIDAPNRGNL